MLRSVRQKNVNPIREELQGSLKACHDYEWVLAYRLKAKDNFSTFKLSYDQVFY